jgi:two-component system chemotaxis response regulator CheY
MGLGRVLVVDDEEDTRKSIRMMLTRGGYDVVEAEDGEKAIAAMNSWDNHLMVDIIILDLYMPKMNGMEALAYFRSQFPSIPVIVLTAKPELLNAEMWKMGQGVMDFLIKPIQPKQLMAAVHRAEFLRAVKGHTFVAA